MPLSPTSGTARVTARVKTGSLLSIRRDPKVRFAAPRSRASLVVPGLSSRDLIVTTTASAGAVVCALYSCAPVKGTGGEPSSSMVMRRYATHLLAFYHVVWSH